MAKTRLTTEQGAAAGYGVRVFKTMGLDADKEAMAMLRRIATLVQPLMTAHLWVLPLLVCLPAHDGRRPNPSQQREFVPGDNMLLGVNINKGKEIRLRLRHPGTTAFYDFDFVMGTMLHELTHNICSAHDAQFYKTLDDLTTEFENSCAGGWNGSGFDSIGIRLGGSSAKLSASEAKAASVRAAEQRAKLSKIMIPAGGVRLGGPGPSSNSDPREMAARAAERRARDRLWCANEELEKDFDGHDDKTPERSKITTRTSGRINGRDRDEVERIGGKRQKISEEVEGAITWKCETCTWPLNSSTLVSCEACFADKNPSPLETESGLEIKNHWVCDACSFYNAADQNCCAVCDRPSPSLISALE
ncbi:hypothetical protein HDU82_000643 [Entophlyctis luteolus]|nr:hypothetical protein HDU82_000643 [Entophlyctis luteolus]